MNSIEKVNYKIGEEEMKLIAGGVELQEKWQKTI